MAKKEDTAYFKKDGIIYVKLSDGRVWCPSAQNRGVRYKIRDDDFPTEFPLSRDFIAIDFETVQHNKKHYPCQLGMVIVQDNQIVDEKNYLIQPPGNKYDPFTQKIHHIRPEMTADKPEFPEIWEEIKEYFDEGFVIAHNLRFDAEVLFNALEYYGIEKPALTHYACTMLMNKHMGLVETCEMYDVVLSESDHHDGLADARACANIFIAMNNGVKAKKVERKKKEKPVENVKQGDLFGDLFAGHEPLRGDVLKPDLTGADPNNPFYDRKVVITGIFDIDRNVLAKKLKSMGADIDNAITKRTNYVIAGREPGPAKIEKLQKLIFDGYNIQRLGQEDLDKIFNGEYEAYMTDKEIKKDLVLTYDHFISPIYHLDFPDWQKNPIVGMEIYCGKGLKGNEFLLAQMAGNNGAFCSFAIEKDTNMCILSDATIEALKNGEKDETIEYIQNTYNSMKAQAFDYKFTSESEFIAWVSERAENLNDGVTARLLERYKELTK